MPVGVGGELLPGCAAAAASPLQAGEQGVSSRSRRLLGKLEPSTSALQRAHDAGTAGTEPRRYNDCGNGGDAGLGWARERRGSPGHQCGRAAAGPSLGQGVGFGCECPRPSALSQPGARLGQGGRHLQQSPGNARAGSELEAAALGSVPGSARAMLGSWCESCWSIAPSPRRDRACTLCLSSVPAAPGTGRKPQWESPALSAPAQRPSHTGGGTTDNHTRPSPSLSPVVSGMPWVGARLDRRSESFELLEKSSSPRAGGRASYLIEVRKSL